MSIQITRINHITYNAPSGSEAKVKKFFGDVLGLQEVPIPKALEGIYEITWFKLGDQTLHIEYIKNFKVHEKDTSGALLPGFHMALEVKDLDGFRKELKAKGANTKDGPVIPDRKRFFVIDPFDNYIELIEMIKK